MHDGLCQEWMQVIVIDDFPAFYHAERRAYLRADPSSGLGCPDGNRVSAVISGKSVALRRRDANLPILRKIYNILSSRTFSDIALTTA